MRPFTKFIGACCKFGQRKDGVQYGAEVLFNQMNIADDVDYIGNFEKEGYKNLFNLHNKYLHH